MKKKRIFTKTISLFKLSTEIFSNIELFFEWFGKGELIIKGPGYYFMNGPEKINLNLHEISISENLDGFNKLFLDLFDEARKEAAKISEEPVGDYVKNQNVSSIFFSILHRLEYLNIEEEYFSLMDLATELFCKILIRHILTNGNKRTAVLFLKLFLKQFNLHFQWSKKFYINKTEEIIGQFVEKLQNSGDPKKQEKKKVYNEIKMWIIKNTILDINDRGEKYE